MIPRLGVSFAGVACMAAAFALAPAGVRELTAPVHWLVRPAVLPFAMRDLEEASRSGDAAETYALAHRVMDLLPTWTDGHIVFAYRFATRSETRERSQDERGEAAWQRLQVALAWLQSVREAAGRREVEVLQAMAMLPQVVAHGEPAVTAKLPPGGAAGMADRFLAEAERLSEGPYVREQRTFLVPRVAAGLLASGRQQSAIAVLESGISRSTDVRERELATEWADLLRLFVRHLHGEEVDLGPVRADSRMSPLLPYLR